MLSRVAIGSTPGYRLRLVAIFCDATFTRPACDAAPMVRTVRAASSSEASEMSSE
ncbi:hypothetical protein D3C72_2495900 [compost metagenome]